MHEVEWQPGCRLPFEWGYLAGVHGSGLLSASGGVCVSGLHVAIDFCRVEDKAPKWRASAWKGIGLKAAFFVEGGFGYYQAIDFQEIMNCLLGGQGFLLPLLKYWG